MTYAKLIRRIYDPIQIAGTHIDVIADEAKRAHFKMFLFNGGVFVLPKEGEPELLFQLEDIQA